MLAAENTVKATIRMENSLFQLPETCSSKVAAGGLPVPGALVEWKSHVNAILGRRDLLSLDEEG